jgi:hypothetical protein
MCSKYTIKSNNKQNTYEKTTFFGILKATDEKNRIGAGTVEAVTF